VRFVVRDAVTCYDALVLEALRDLVAHKGYANAAILGVVGENGAAADDRELIALLHHVLLSNRFWILAILGLPFAADDESRLSHSFDELVQRFSSTQEQESRWLAAATEADLTRVLRGPLIPGGKCSVAEALLQVCMHSHGHRAQIAKRLRQHGAVPPTTDFINWLTNRPAAAWPLSAAPPGC
jgi:uncharacterized damage-inducible protein DinB